MKPTSDICKAYQEMINEAIKKKAFRTKGPGQKVKPVLIPKVTSLMDLRNKASDNPLYAQLAILGAQNLGGDIKNLNQAFDWLNTNAMETDEQGVVDEVNFMRDLVKPGKTGLEESVDEMAKIIAKHYADSKHKQKYTDSTHNSSWKKADDARKILNKKYAGMKTEAVEGKQINIFVDKKQVETDATSKEPEEAIKKFAKEHPEIELVRIDAEWQNPAPAPTIEVKEKKSAPASLKQLLEEI
jgi:hypothetical protein